MLKVLSLSLTVKLLVVNELSLKLVSTLLTKEMILSSVLVEELPASLPVIAPESVVLKSIPQ